jgi:alkylhydroperoxidase/carboxymuconolactone decarboxylase family protein YurZ
MPPLPQPPEAYSEFVRRFPTLGEAWNLAQDAGTVGPLDRKVQRLVKLAIAIGGRQPGAVHSATRKAVAAGATVEEIEQVIALAAGTIGFPAAVAAFTWVREELAPQPPAG